LILIYKTFDFWYDHLDENFIARRTDLTGSKARMVDVHEAIHTPDEYETRILTDWMLTREKPGTGLE